jgi:hypothetical protein
VLIPVLVIGLWLITAKSKYIGDRFKNRWWENAFIAFLLLLGLVSAYFSIQSLGKALVG